MALKRRGALMCPLRLHVEVNSVWLTRWSLGILIVCKLAMQATNSGRNLGVSEADSKRQNTIGFSRSKCNQLLYMRLKSSVKCAADAITLKLCDGYNKHSWKLSIPRSQAFEWAFDLRLEAIALTVSLMGCDLPCVEIWHQWTWKQSW